MLVHQRVSNESLRIAQKNLLVGKVENLTQSHRSCTVEPSVRLKPNEGHFGSHWRQWYLTDEPISGDLLMFPSGQIRSCTSRLIHVVSNCFLPL